MTRFFGMAVIFVAGLIVGTMNSEKITEHTQNAYEAARSKFQAETPQPETV